jgi:hypothetical protein
VIDVAAGGALGLVARYLDLVPADARLLTWLDDCVVREELW